ncbi:MAG: LysM peptidoglycan-binding domain-containing protein [Desulfovibrionales bacterium]|nr:LysM peptidoglycan-binding domain-containing protein [Desulfovibrionales bacterium]
MRFTFLVQITCLIFILTGCHPLNINPSPKDNSQALPHTSTLSPNKEAADKRTKDSNYSQKNQHHSKHHKEDGSQKKIDQALELCTIAQDMWEEGRLEDAIANLDNAYYLILEIESDSDFEVNQQKEDIRFLISKRILEIYASRQVVVKGKHNEIPIPMNDHVKREIKRLTGPEKRYLTLSIERSRKYRPFIVKELQKAGLPEELSWLPLIESGFKLRALSHARALGLWQFIPSTGHRFGLKRNYYVDERMDPEKSTLAAISYLKELHNLFGDWATVLAAYNCGEGRVLKTIRRQRINYLDNFWDLYQNLPRETARYVPRFFATLHIIKNLDSYNFKLKTPPPLAYKTVSIKKQVLLKDISKTLKIKTSILKNLNPELRYGLLPPETYALKVPEKYAETLASKIDQIKSTYTPPPMFVYHRVRRGDTLSQIARRYKSSVRAISRANGIRSHRIIAGKVIKIPSRHRGIGMGSASASRYIAKGNSSKLKYKVKQGDNLWLIARKFSTTTKSLMKTNRLKTPNLKIGQTLIIRTNKSTQISQGTYQVQSGDSPFLIAKKHNMSLNRFLALNRLNKASKIYPGQKLIVE